MRMISIVVAVFVAAAVNNQWCNSYLNLAVVCYGFTNIVHEIPHHEQEECFISADLISIYTDIYIYFFLIWPRKFREMEDGVTRSVCGDTHYTN